jgi:hypothetical protein
VKLIQNKRAITWRPIKRLDQQLEPNMDISTSSGTGTDHTHSNKSLLDSLSIDANGRLKSSGQLVNIPLIQEEW